MTLAWAQLPAPAPVGRLTIGVTDAGLACVAFRSGSDVLTAAARLTGRTLVVDESRTGPVADQLVAYLGGRRREFDVALDWGLADGATRMVLQTLFTSVGYGATTTYGELARRSGAFPGADGVLGARAVGSIMAANPIPVIVPCHRVLAVDGLGGFGGGLAVKRWLLELEGALPPALGFEE